MKAQQHSKNILLAKYWILNVLNGLDSSLTVYGSSIGIKELNPVINWTISYIGLLPTFTIKILICFLISTIILRFKKEKAKNLFFDICITAYVLVCIWNLCII